MGGYNVRDATGRGHDLRMSYVPQWKVVNWLSICGNGIVEGSEDCDDGNHNDGDGCSHVCQTEPGWFCTKERPSISSYDPHNHDSQTNNQSSQSGKSKSHGGLITFLVFTVIFGVLGTVAYVKRDEIYDRFPKVRVAVENIKEKVFRRERNYDMLHLGPGEADILAPEFIGMQPGPTGNYRAPEPTPEPTETQDELH